MQIDWLGLGVSLVSYVAMFCVVRHLAMRDAENMHSEVSGSLKTILQVMEDHRTLQSSRVATQNDTLQAVQKRVWDMAKRQDGMSKNLVGLRRTLDTLEHDEPPSAFSSRFKASKFRD